MHIHDVIKLCLHVLYALCRDTDQFLPLLLMLKVESLLFLHLVEKNAVKVEACCMQIHAGFILCDIKFIKN